MRRLALPTQAAWTFAELSTGDVEAVGGAMGGDGGGFGVVGERAWRGGGSRASPGSRNMEAGAALTQQGVGGKCCILSAAEVSEGQLCWQLLLAARS